MSSWGFDSFQTQHKNNPQWHISVSYRWNKGNTYETYVGVFDSKGIEKATLFKGIYSNKESAKRSYQRQVLRIKKGEY